jgi:peroxiredoxin
MKKILTVCALLLTPVITFAAAEIGAPAPDFSLKSADGEEVKLSDFAGKNVILEWTNHECPFVKKHYGSGNMQSLQEKYTEQDVVWLSIISSAPGKQGFVDAEQANALTEDRDAKPSAVLFDPSGEVGKSYNAKTTPHMYIVNKKGELVYAGGIDSIQSANPDDIKKADNYVDMAMAEVLAGESVTRASTRPYGCSVKYK